MPNSPAFGGRKLRAALTSRKSAARWRKWLRAQWWESSLGTVVNILLRVGALLLLALLFVFVYRILQEPGYVLEPLSVPKLWAESGYQGEVVARQLQDQVVGLKELAQSVKADSVLFSNPNQPEFDVAVLGIGLSFRSITYQLRELLGRPNRVIRGEITHLGGQARLVLRMSGFPVQHFRVTLDEAQPEAALQQLLRQGAEAILGNLDPYRMAILCHRQQRYGEALEWVHRMLSQRPDEAHWAYVAWGSVLEDQLLWAESAEKFRRATVLKPDFDLAWTRLAMAEEKRKDHAAALAAMRRAVELSPHTGDRWLGLAWMLHRQGQYAAADSAFARAEEVYGPTDAAEGLASWVDSKMNRKDTTGIDQLVRRLEAKVGDNSQGYTMLALVSVARGDTAAAIARLRQAFDLDPANVFAGRMCMQGAYYQQRDYAEALRLYRRMRFGATGYFQGQVGQAHNLAAMAYNHLGQRDSAFAAVRRAIAADPAQSAPYTTLAETYAFEQQWDSCYHHLNRAFELGFLPTELPLHEAPYRTLNQQPPFRRLLDKYTQGPPKI